MEEFSDWLYWIIIIIAGLGSIIGSINKKMKQAGEDRQPHDVVKEEWVDWDDTPPAVPEKQPVPDLLAQRKAAFNYGTLSQKTKQADDYSIFRKEAAPVYVDDDVEPVCIDDAPAGAEEWRKAFIYSEIFNRKQ
jgi:hypothetical protein